MTTQASEFIWKASHVVQLFEFPWRFLMCMMFGSSVLIGGLIIACPPRWQRIAAVGLVGLLIIFNLGYCYKVKYQQLHFSDIKTFLTNSLPEDNGSFLPIWVKQIDLNAPAAKLQVWDGQADIVDNSQGSALKWDFNVNAKIPSMMRFNSYYYPGWTVHVDGKPVVIHTENPYGLIAFELSPGEHHVQIQWGTIFSREAAQWVSLTALAVLSIMLFI